MLDFLNAWQRYQELQYWWLHLMTFVWFIFTLVLFVIEPLFLHKWFNEQAKENSEKTFARIQLMHYVLLILSLIAVLGAVAGSHSYF
jgi:peptidoglycan biosynthesis protein MviN/MurJ (putative lipid II flippase)